MSEIVIDEVGRPEPPLAAGETATLLGFLDYQRATLEWKCRGLSNEQLRARLHPTGMTLAGMLAHLGTVEDFWFTQVVAGESYAAYWPDDVDAPEWEWTRGASLAGDDLRARWQASVERSRAVVGAELDADGAGLDGVHAAWGGRAQVSLRWVLTHMIEEYARHNGHADVLREAVDGQVGE